MSFKTIMNPFLYPGIHPFSKSNHINVLTTVSTTGI